jgi:Cu(I)/Ag(I) efflux system protein CusF
MKTLVISLLAAALAGPAYAQMKDHSGDHGAASQSEAKAHSGVGVVKSVDAEKGTVMLAHEPIPSMRWPSMTMKFIAGDRKLLEKLTPGKRVEFDFVQRGRDYVLTRLK